MVTGVPFRFSRLASALLYRNGHRPPIVYIKFWLIRLATLTSPLKHNAPSFIYLLILLARYSRLGYTSMLFLCLSPVWTTALSTLHLQAKPANHLNLVSRWQLALVN
jgi:hypothetical protein